MFFRKFPRSASPHLDALRGLAAVAVCIGHDRTSLFRDFHQIPHPGLFLKTFYFLTGFGHQAVIVFFVLSGFFVSSSALRAITRDEWSWSEYLLQRLTRLYLVLIPALVVSGAFDWVGVHLFPGMGSPYRGNTHGAAGGLADVTQTLTAGNFAGNLLFLEFLPLWGFGHVSSFGSNGVTWSLADEAWFYVLFPCLALAWMRRTRPVARVLFLAAVPIILSLMGAANTINFAVWLFGVGVALLMPVPGGPNASRAAALAGAILFATVLAISRFVFTAADDFVVGLATAALVYGILTMSARTTPSDASVVRGYRRVATTFSSFSYSLYLTHSESEQESNKYLLYSYVLVT